LRRFSRKEPAHLAPVAVERAIANALFLLEPRLRKEQVETEQHLPDPGLHVLADANRLEQVLVNLIANALDAMAGAPVRRLTVTAQRDGERVTIAVADTGPGIPEAARGRLFEPFFTTKPQGAGLGLGLAISAGIVREFGGSLEAANGATGGAAFNVHLRPAHCAVEPEKQEDEA
jgi:two-component system C4-dicarboxylate transport sensor histidine kinase DctB